MTHKDLSLALFTDLYELTMAQAYWQSGQTATATFTLYFRQYPPDRAFFVCAGVADALEYLEGFGFSSDDLDFLRSLNVFDDGFLDYLGQMRFTGSVRAMSEGAIFFANEPVLEVTAPVIEAQVAETYLLNRINLQTILATKASRVVHAARGRTVVDFAARRAHGTDAAIKMARASYMVGFAGTSNVMAGRLHGIPVHGTMAHSFIMSFESEVEAYRAYARSFPDSSMFLVDTYDTVEGTRKAIEVAREMRRDGHELRGIRLDSGDLARLPRESRALLDTAGFQGVWVFASGGLDELAVDELLWRGAPIDGFGVGTLVGVSADAPWADCVYKLVAYGGRPVAKLSSEKQTLPGPKQVYRSRDGAGSYVVDLVARAEEPPPADGAEPLLQEVMTGGRRFGPSQDLAGLRESFQRDFARLPVSYKALRSPPEYRVDISDDLEALRRAVAGGIGQREGFG